MSDAAELVLKAPFHWFGGKSRVAPEVWAALGDVDNYVEPFAGSLAVLLGRPGWDGAVPRWTETVNDLDGYLANFWRALAAEPEAVAEWCDWPVNECDLTARHLWLVNDGRERIARLSGDPDWYDAKVAGWWVWGINSWIGSGWCSGKGPWVRGSDGVLVDRRTLDGNTGRGVNRQLPHLGDRGEHAAQRWAQEGALYAYFAALSARLRRVRVCCGDWQRVVTKGAMAYGASVGVFLDPPYDEDVRNDTLYRTDGAAPKLSTAVRDWAVEHGDDKRLRIVLCGYEGEHDMPATWRVHAYKASAAYQTASGKGANRENRHKERLWFSPGCLNPAAAEPLLFGSQPPSKAWKALTGMEAKEARDE